MAATITVSVAFDTSDFFEVRNGAATVLDGTTYRYPIAGFFMEVTGTGLTYSGQDPDGGNYTQIRAYSDDTYTTLVATFASDTDIPFNSLFDSELVALAESDTFTGSSGDDVVTLHDGADTADGADGSDTYRFFSGDINAGEIVDDTGTGVGDFDVLSIADFRVDFRRTATLDGLEGVRFDALAGTSTAFFNASQFGVGQLPTDLTITGRPGMQDIVEIREVGTFDAQLFQFVDWDDQDVLSFEGTTGSNDITGSDRADTFNGLGGADRLRGEDGNDIFLIRGGEALTAIIDGGPGIDTVQTPGSPVALRSFDAAESSIERWVGNNRGVVGTAAENDFDFSHLTEVIRLGFVDGHDRNDRITGSRFADDLRGNDGNDILNGGAGRDTLRGGQDKDLLTGGADRDIFLFRSITESKVGSANRDQILHFQRGTDDIDLSDIDAKTGSGNDKFKFIGKDAFNEVKGELRYKDLGSKVIVQGDVNGDGKADFEIFVKVSGLSKGDFLL